MKRLLLWLPLAIVSCVEEIGFAGYVNDDCEGVVEVVLDVAGSEYVRSSLTIDEYLLTDLVLVVYRNGLLESHEYFPSAAERLKLKLMEGQSYNMYVLANVGNVAASVHEEDFRNDCLYSIDSISDMDERLPMSWYAIGVKVVHGMGAIDVQLERLAARIQFSLDKELLGGLEVTSVMLCQCASVVRPFKYMGKTGSRAESALEIISGDMASAEDLAELNDGGSVCFYTLENCQGILLPDNVLSSRKLPGAIGDKSELCTYLEVAGVFAGDGFLEGEVRYRFYLGLDATSSFDVPGNSCIDVKLQLTDAGLREVSWRVEADVSVRDGYAWGAVEKGLHRMDDLYVGEKLLYRVEVSDELLSYMGGDMSGAFLWYDSDFGALDFTPLRWRGKVSTSEISCRASSKGKLYLCSPEGEKLAILCPSVSVGVPEIVVAEYVSYEDGEPVEGLTYPAECVINGGTQELYVYLTDRQGVNLNSSSAYGFDLDIFDFQISAAAGAREVGKAFEATFAKGAECSGGYASSMRLSCAHDGKDGVLALGLAEVYGHAQVLPMTVCEQTNALSGRFGVCLGIHPVTLTLVDNGWAGYHSTQLSVMVDNKSEMPLEMIVCQMVDNNQVWFPSLLTTEIKEYVEHDLERLSIEYMTGSVDEYGQTMHVSSARVQCVGSGVFPLNGIDTSDLLKSLVYDMSGQDRMYHLVDVTMGGFQIFKSDISLTDALTDGSSLYDAIYLSDRNSKGVWLYSNDVPVQSAGNYMVHFPNLSPLKIERMRQRYESCPALGLHLWYDGSEFRGYVSDSHATEYGLTMTVRFKGEVQGYVQTDPKGFWGSVKDNYCTASFDRTIKGVPLADLMANVSMDGGCVKQAMDAIYAQTFEDKKDGKKFQHAAHPVSIECDVDLYVEGENGQELYPMRVFWECPYVSYGHVQDAVTYTCPVTVNTSLFNAVLVDKSFVE